MVVSKSPSTSKCHFAELLVIFFCDFHPVFSPVCLSSLHYSVISGWELIYSTRISYSARPTALGSSASTDCDPPITVQEMMSYSFCTPHPLFIFSPSSSMPPFTTLPDRYPVRNIDLFIIKFFVPLQASGTQWHENYPKENVPTKKLKKFRRRSSQSRIAKGRRYHWRYQESEEFFLRMAGGFPTDQSRRATRIGNAK